MLKRGTFAIAAAAVAWWAAGAALGADWPMWRHDAGRSAVSPEALPRTLHLQWVRSLPPPAPAWPEGQTKLQFDASYEPVVAGQRLFVASMVTDDVTCYDTRTGREHWRFRADGPVRFAPVAWADTVAFGSDDGHVYALDAATGELRWKFRAGPSDRRVLGNERLISTWPVRGAPVLADGRLYVAAGIWPFMGIFLYALDADTGRVVWANTGSGSIYTKQQHDSPAFAGVAPQGYLAVAGDRLLVSGGRTVPAVYDRRSGRFLYFRVSSRTFGRDAGGYEVVAAGDGFLNGGVLYALKDGAGVLRTGATLPSADALLGLEAGQVAAYAFRPQEWEVTDAWGRKHKEKHLPRLWEAETDVPLDRAFIRAGPRLYAAGRDGLIAAVDVPPSGERARVSWQGRIEGDPWTMLAADGRLFVVTREGRLTCFGGEPCDAAAYAYRPAPIPLPPDRWAADVEDVLEASGARAGYALVLGVGTGRLAEELIRRSDLYVIAVDPDAERVSALRSRLEAAGVYGRRASVHVGDPASFALPPYLADLVVSEDPEAAGLARGAEFVRSVFRALRPYGAAAWLTVPERRADDLERWVAEAGLPKAVLLFEGRWTRLVRVGSLPGSADWTHQYADVANTVVSQDDLVRAPLGLLWFGGPAHDPVLPRHGHGPSPQVVDGRLFIEGRDLLRAVDIYTGRLLWERPIKDLGLYYDNTDHQPGANKVGSNYASVSDGIYVAHGAKCLRLDPETGATRREFSLPAEKALRGARWGHVGIYRDLLIATAVPVDVEFQQDAATKRVDDVAVAWNARYGPASRWLLVLDRHTGEVLWKREAAVNFRHNAIVAGAGKVFCIDGQTPERLTALRFRGLAPKAPATLYALDAATGKVLWKTSRDVFGTWLAYAESRDILLEAGSPSRDRALDEPDAGLAAYRGADGKVLWTSDAEYAGPCMLHGDTILTQDEALDLLTGKPRTRVHPLTGEAVEWTYTRNYGCNTAIASRHLILFRSAAAGYYDLDGDSGTGNLGGFKSGCTSNLIAAGGLLSAPDFTRTCTCSYQNQCSVAFVHDPDVETWTFSPMKWNGEPIRRIGLNLGAPGDRLAPGGTLWLEWPIVGGPSPVLSVQTAPRKPDVFRQHASWVVAGDLKWVAASGLEGLKSLTLSLDEDATTTRRYTVRLHFAEPEDRGAGERVFSVSLQGREVLRDFDVAKEAGGPRRAVVREFKGVEVTGDLDIGFTPRKGKPLLCGLEAVLE